MLEALLRYLARALASILERFADPDLQAKLDAFNEKVAAADVRAKEAEKEALVSEAQYQLSVDRRKEFDRLLEDSIAQEQELRARLSASQARVREIEAQAAKLKSEIDAKSDAEKVRVDL